MTLIFAVTSGLLMNCLLLVPHVEKKLPPEPQWNGTLHYVCKLEGHGLDEFTECTVYNTTKVHPVLEKSGMRPNEWYQLKNDELISQSNCFQILNVTLKVTSGCLDSAENISQSAELDSLLCILDCTKYPKEFLNPPKPEREMYGKTFWMTFALYFVGFNVKASMWALLYGMNYAILGEKRNNFGKQRMWGTFGALCTSAFSAIAMNKYGSVTPEITYIPCFIGFGFWIVVTGIAAMFFKLPHMTRNPTMAKDMFKLLKQPAIFSLFIVSLEKL